MIALGDDVLLWFPHGPVLGVFFGLAKHEGCRVVMVRPAGEHEARPFAPEICTPAGKVMEALKRGSRFHWIEGNA